MALRRLLILGAAGLCLLANANAQPDTVRVSLQESIDWALRVSPDLEAARASERFAEARSDMARRSRFLTEMSFEAAFSAVPGLTNPNRQPVDALYLDPEVRNDFSSISPYAQTRFDLLQPIHTFGALRGNMRAAEYGAQVEGGVVRAAELAVMLRAADLYFNVLLTDALYNLTEDAAEVVEQAQEEIMRLLDEGDPEVDEADRYQVLITEQELQRRTREVREQRLLARSGLRRQLMLSAGTTVVLEESALEPMAFLMQPLEDYYDIARSNRPELIQARAGLLAREAQYQVARAEYYPQIFFGLSSSVTGAANRHRQPNPFISDAFRRSSARVGIGFRQKLNFALTKTRVRQAEARRDEVQSLLRAAEELVLYSVEEAYRNVTIAESALAAQDSSLAISKEWLRVETINFDLDLGSTENLIDAVQANLELEARYLEAVQAFNRAVLGLQHALGTRVGTRLDD